METQGGIAGWIDWHNSLEIPEEKMDDGEKTITTRYTPLGVIGAICPVSKPKSGLHAGEMPACLASS
jgi:acyl-CoA reductase-like NAD-dependent aldehyde dehydrogenase